MIACNIHVQGKVQGVFFRDWTVSAARALGVTGWVRHCRDGSVEVLAQGDPPLVDRFVERLRQGSPASEVEHVEVKATDPEEAHGFFRRATA